MKFNLQIALPALAQGIIGAVALTLVAFASPEAICSGTVAGG